MATPNGNWAARTDDRLLTGARYAIQGTNQSIPGRKVLGWWWNVKQGGSYPYPYVDAAAFYEDTLTLVEGWEGRPLIWNSGQCFLYPSVSSNKRSDLGVVFHYGSGALQTPSVGYCHCRRLRCRSARLQRSTPSAPATPGHGTTCGATTTPCAASTRWRPSGSPAHTTLPAAPTAPTVRRRSFSPSVARVSVTRGPIGETSSLMR